MSETLFYNSFIEKVNPNFAILFKGAPNSTNLFLRNYSKNSNKVFVTSNTSYNF